MYTKLLLEGAERMTRSDCQREREKAILDRQTDREKHKT